MDSAFFLRSVAFWIASRRADTTTVSTSSVGGAASCATASAGNRTAPSPITDVRRQRLADRIEAGSAAATAIATGFNLLIETD
jgi:hypothetical protein